MTFLSVTQQLLTGFGNTCLIFALTLVFSLPLGLLVAFCSMSRFQPLRYLSRTLVWIIRGTPLMLQIIVVFYGPGLLAGADSFPRMTAVLVAFIINYACYFSEIFRGGIESIPKGQYEAAQVLGMTKSQCFFKVILLQVVTRIVPPLSNEIIRLVKDTSRARIVAVRESIVEAQVFIKKGFIWPLFYSGAFYLIFCGLLTILFHRIEKGLDYFRV